MFETEVALVESLVETIDTGSVDYFKKTMRSDFRVLREVGLGYGIADVVLTNLSSRGMGFQNQVERSSVQLLYAIESQNPVELDVLKKLTCSSDSLLRKNLRFLESAGKILVDDGLVRLAYSPDKVEGRSIAIEAKLHNWRRALGQAYRYRGFAELSYVCLPESNITPALSSIDTFRNMGVGLFSLDKRGRVRFYFRPRATRPHDRVMRMTLGCSIPSLVPAL